MGHSTTYSRKTAARRGKKTADPKVRPTTSKGRQRQAVKKITKAKSPGRVKSAIGGRKPIRTFKAALDFLNSQVNYERRPPTSRAKARGVYTLTRIKRLLADLDNPHRTFRSVHIGGTKGKGSTATMLANMLQGNGLRVGLYTSPHVVCVRERIVINGEQISESAFARAIGAVAEVVARYKTDAPTYFEILTAAAFYYFREKKIDIAVVEVGLGGRYDATNVLRPEVCGITNISLDHMSQLGGTLEEITEEKAGIFKENVPVVCAPQPKNVKLALRKAAEKTKSPLMFAGNESGDQIELSYRFESSRSAGPQARICVTTPTSHFDHLAVPLVGEHQAVNCGVAIGILDQLKGRGFAIDDEAAIAGLSKVKLEGRMEMICDEPRVLVDAAHNAASIEALMRAIGQNIPCETMVVIFGCCNDKDIDGMLRQIQLGADKVIFTNVQNSRSAEVRDLATRFSEISGNGRMAQVANNLSQALVIAQKAITREDLICVTGSFYLVSEAKALFADHPHRVESTCSGAV